MEDYETSDDENCYEDYDYSGDDDDSLDALQDLEIELTCTDNSSSCKVIPQESLLAAQREDLQRVMDLLSLQEHHARTLLIYYSWNVDKVFTIFVDNGKDKLYTEAGVRVEEHHDIPSVHCSSEITCGICMEEVPINEATTMDCGHCFCSECWTEHFIVKINEGQSRRIGCMAHKCYAICDEGKIRNLVRMRNPNLAEKFDRFLLESYVEDNKRVKWCPSIPHCGNAIRVEDDEYCEVECACGLQFCFGCSAEAHSPCSCLMWKLWDRKCKDESETYNWITVNTKPCPKCSKPVEKNGGCNLVECICGQPFCWLCAGATRAQHTWDTIEGHECGRYNEDFQKKIEVSKKELWRFIHYHNRYKAHVDSSKAEVNLKENMQLKISKLEATESTVKDFSWVTNGFSRLFRSRRILSYSYPFAYYLFGDHHLFKGAMTHTERKIRQNLFEDQQQQLEANVEKLSLFLEEPFEDYDEEDKIMESRLRVITLSAVTNNLCKKLYEYIENDLLGPLQMANHIIAPYRSEGVPKAAELSVQSGPAILGDFEGIQEA